MIVVISSAVNHRYVSGARLTNRNAAAGQPLMRLPWHGAALIGSDRPLLRYATARKVDRNYETLRIGIRVSVAGAHG